MKHAVLYNVFLCWIVSLMGMLIARHILSLKSSDSGDRAFGYFWLMGSGLWGFSGARLIAAYLGHDQLDLKLFYVVSFFIGGQLVPGVYFLSHRASKNIKFIGTATAIAVVLCIAFQFFMFYDGVRETFVTQWATEHEMPQRAFRIFMPVYLYCVVMTVYDIARRVVDRLLRGISDRPAFFAIVAMLVYEAVGFIDARGYPADYTLLVIRGLYMVSALIAYLSYSWDSSSVNIARRRGTDSQ